MSRTRKPVLDVHGATCLHVWTDRDGVKRTCGEPVRVGGPNGWLCGGHDAAVFPRRDVDRGAPQKDAANPDLEFVPVVH